MSQYTLTFLEDVTLFDKANKGWLYKRGESFSDVRLLDTVTHHTDYSSYILDVPLFGARRRVVISSSVVRLSSQEEQQGAGDE